MPSTLLEQLLELPEEKIIESMAQHGTKTPERDEHKLALDILHRRQMFNTSKKKNSGFGSTLWKVIKILWVPIAILATIISLWNQQFWDFVEGLWHMIF